MVKKLKNNRDAIFMALLIRFIKEEGTQRIGKLKAITATLINLCLQLQHQEARFLTLSHHKTK